MDGLPDTVRGLRGVVGLRMISVGRIAEEFGESGCDHGYISRLLRQKQKVSRAGFQKLRAAVARASKKRCAGRSSSSRRRDTGA